MRRADQATDRAGTPVIKGLRPLIEVSAAKDAHPGVSQAGAREDILVALEKLPDDEREAVGLIFFNELTQAEAADSVSPRSWRHPWSDWPAALAATSPDRRSWSTGASRSREDDG